MARNLGLPNLRDDNYFWNRKYLFVIKDGVNRIVTECFNGKLLRLDSLVSMIVCYKQTHKHNEG